MKRRAIFSAALAAAIAATAGSASAEPPPLKQKDRYKVGFAQMESNNPWRIAETKSFKDTAESCNWDLIATDAAGSAAKQVADVDSMIAQGIDVLFLPPREEKPLIPAVKKAKAAGIPTFLVDRSVDESAAKAGEDYVSFLGSDFVDQGRQVMETLLQANPDVNIVYAHNDEMAIGAIQALELAGRKPGKDVMIVSIDGTRDALQAISDGKMGVTVESSPFFGPLACEVMERYASGEKIEPWVQVKDRVFTVENAADNIADAY